jgi:hypothetical protein
MHIDFVTRHSTPICYKIVAIKMQWKNVHNASGTSAINLCSTPSAQPQALAPHPSRYLGNDE